MKISSKKLFIKIFFCIFANHLFCFYRTSFNWPKQWLHNNKSEGIEDWKH